jgi:hypothetical protein
LRFKNKIMALSETDISLKITNDIDYNNNEHYEYIRDFLGFFMDDNLFSCISYLFGNIKIIKKHNPLNWKIIINMLSKCKQTDLIDSIIYLLLEKINIKIICLCASHIDDINRLEKLENMLNTWNKQIYKVKIILSLSCNKNLVDKTLTKVNELKCKFGEDLIVLYNFEQKTQFEHYKFICDNLYEQFKDHWVFFSDDDDIWSDKRSFIFSLMIQNLINGDLIDKVSYIEYPFMCEGNKYISSNEEVYFEMVANTIQIKNRNESGGMLEYICYCTKFDNFKSFINKSNLDILRHELCDRYFIKYLKMCPNINKSTMILPFFGFSYYYFNNKYLGQRINKLDIDSEEELVKFAKYIVIVHYSMSTKENLFVKNINNCFLKSNFNSEQRNKIAKKCFDILKHDEFVNFKNSPILTDGFINEIREIYV